MTIHWRLSLAAGILGLVLAGCSQPPVKPTQATKPDYSSDEQARMEVERLLKQAAKAPTIQAARLRVQAANILIRMDRKEAALSILGDVELEYLPPSLRYEVAQSRARAAQDAQQPQEALRYLEFPADSTYRPSLEQATRIGELRAEAFRLQNDPVSEALELIQISTNEQDPALLQQLHNQIWNALRMLPPDQLQSLSLQTGNTYYEQGWFELALIHKQARGLDQLNELTEEWNTLWESHPAHLVPPQSEAITSSEPILAQRIAVLLPMQGKLNKAATAIREGIMAAYFNDQAYGKPVPEIQFVDSTQVSEPIQLQNLINEQQIDLVIGPLQKSYVSALNRSAPMPAPVLALNYDHNSEFNQVFQFGLAAEDEARQAARKIWSDGHRIALALVPMTNWGTRIRDAFEEEFTALGGTVADSTRFDRQEDFSRDISSLLATDKSAERAKQIFQMSSRKVKFEERRRKDVDAIFLSALPGDARQIKPILAFHYAGNLPIYATSHVFAGTSDSQRDRDLNGIQFVDAPWSLTAPSETKRYLAQKRQDTDTRFGRLYALGIDAYKLYPYLNQLATSEGASIQGETGALSVNPDKTVVRILQWAQFRKGSPQMQQARTAQP
ncbi:penicillin-binding protein activator [Pontibacterium sp.]|uniref:penicillin-binding protein activator n=1 Tax=Pontibacterium sp. TaxID=2036026 RepID=UPI0035125873